MFPGPDGNDATDQKSVGKSGDGFVVVECVDGQQLRDVDVDENDVAVGVERCLKSKPKFYIKIRVGGYRGQFCKKMPHQSISELTFKWVKIPQ
jgi:hypothetical protein